MNRSVLICNIECPSAGSGQRRPPAKPIAPRPRHGQSEWRGMAAAANVACGAMVASSKKQDVVPIVAPIIVGHPPTIPGGTVSTEAAWREWAYGGGNTNF